MDKAHRLKKLQEEIVHNTTLPLTTNLVFGEGNPDCQVLFIGEAPGALEDQMVRPFVGRSGQLLRKCIRDLGWQESDVYITNIVKRRPPENRDPLPEEIAAYKPYLTRQIEIINPNIIVTLGRFSMNYFLPEAKITRDQGKLFQLGADQKSHEVLQTNLLKPRDQQKPTLLRFVAPMFHPAAALRSTGAMKEFTESFKKLPQMLKKVEEIKK